ncbi:mRNA surveillance protein pelota [Candidatus Woesearchaeota archaeon]|nr:mRNA surveillance protein pelota [Candidatus Woesearchaeota archaeon]
MQIIHQDFKNGEIKVKITELEDLWYLSHIIDKKDKITGRTIRKIKLDKEGEKSGNIIKKPAVLSIETEKVEFNPESGILRISGVIREGPEDVQKGVFHTINVEENSIITIKKPQWLKFQIEKLKEASNKSTPNILICVMDRDEASFALLKKYGYEMLSDISGEVEKKYAKENLKEGAFYSDLIKKLQDYVNRFNIEKVIIASPAFWKEDLFKEIQKKDLNLAKKITVATCNNTGKNGIDEVLKRDEVKSVLKQERLIKETNLVERLLMEIAKDNLGVYGFNETKDAVRAGAVEVLLVSDDLIKKLREKEEYEGLDNLMKNVEAASGEIFIISVEHDAGKKLKGLGGIGAILRYKLKY